MKYSMKKLWHKGVCIPCYEYHGFSVGVRGTPVKLTQHTEQMAIAWVRKEQSLTTPPDRVFYRNFMQVFLKELRTENPNLDVLRNLQIRDDADPIVNGKPREDMEIDFSQIREFLRQEQAKKLSQAKEEKKALAAERKKKREELRRIYGFAIVDDKEIEIANYTAEPSCLFAGRGEHPKRGSWKQGPKQSDITLNISEDCPMPPGEWKGRVWEPTRMYIAKWEDQLSGKIKYVWFSDSTFLKQMREQEKFEKAENLGKKIHDVEAHINENLNSDDKERRKIATVCWLIFQVNMRVGDEKDPGEADTVGAITLRPEHIIMKENLLHFDFLGKDAVRWTKDVEAPPEVIRNIRHYSETCKEYLFEGIDSKKVARFFNEKVKGLTAKVFRTWRCTETVKKELEKCDANKSDPEYKKKFCAKMANLEAAKIANHKRKVPANYDQRLADKEAKLKNLETTLKEKMVEDKKTDSVVKRLDKSRLDLKLAIETKEYNLGTSLKSYVDPIAYVKWANRMDFDLEKFYPKTLLNKYSWAIRKKTAREPEVRQTEKINA